MMKSWADHCSSDEDTDDNYSIDSEDQNEEQSIEDAFSAKVQVDDNEGDLDEGVTGQPVRTYDFPDRPPFTAFVGNLSYDIQEPSQLQKALADVIFDRLGERVNVLGGRISYDRDSKNRQHRGFGYVELETLEQLKTVMRLNDDGQALLAGRKIQVDTANHHNRPNNNYNRRGQGSYNHNQRGSFHRRSNTCPSNNEPVEKIDGTKFRGGKYNNTSNQRNNSFTNNSMNNSFQKTSASGDAPRQRPSLKLAPRSKRIDGVEHSSSSDIFGGAKARDEQAWEKGRQQDQQASGGDEKKKTTIASKKGGEDNNSNSNKSTGKDKKMENQDRRQSGRGGGRGGKGRGNHHRGGNNNAGRGDQNNQNHRRGSGRRHSQQQYDKKLDKRQQQTAPEAKAATVAKANNKQTDTTPSNPEPKAPKNKFALLMDDSDSD